MRKHHKHLKRYTPLNQPLTQPLTKPGYKLADSETEFRKLAAELMAGAEDMRGFDDPLATKLEKEAHRLTALADATSIANQTHMEMEQALTNLTTLQNNNASPIERLKAAKELKLAIVRTQQAEVNFIKLKPANNPLSKGINHINYMVTSTILHLKQLFTSTK